jgi:hypothetical protein
MDEERVNALFFLKSWHKTKNPDIKNVKSKKPVCWAVFYLLYDYIL